MHATTLCNRFLYNSLTNLIKSKPNVKKDDIIFSLFELKEMGFAKVCLGLFVQLEKLSLMLRRNY